MRPIVVERMDIRLDLIKPSPYQPRLSFDLDVLKASVQRDGILVALTVRKKGGAFELVDGERRWRAAKELGLATVPCDIISIDDDTARQMVWKVNTFRRDYEPREKAFFFRRMREIQKMTFASIANKFDIDSRDVKAYLNVFKMPSEYQQMVWDKTMPIRNVRELDQLFTGVSTATPEENPEIFDMLDRSVKERHFGAEQIREAIKPYLARLRRSQIEEARKALAKIEPEAKIPKTAEELSDAAKLLRREARRRKTPEQKIEDKRAKARRIRDNMIRLLDRSSGLLQASADKYQAQIGEFETRIQKEPTNAISELTSLRAQIQMDVKKVRADKERQQLEEEIRDTLEQRLEDEKRRIADVAKTEARRELLKDPKFLEQVAETIPQRRATSDWRGTEVPARGPDKEIVTEDIWECPICQARHRLIHLEPRGHRLEKIRGD